MTRIDSNFFGDINPADDDILCYYDGPRIFLVNKAEAVYYFHQIDEKDDCFIFTAVKITNDIANHLKLCVSHDNTVTPIYPRKLLEEAGQWFLVSVFHDGRESDIHEIEWNEIPLTSLPASHISL